jgi:hypothetical protein
MHGLTFTGALHGHNEDDSIAEDAVLGRLEPHHAGHARPGVQADTHAELLGGPVRNHEVLDHVEEAQRDDAHLTRVLCAVTYGHPRHHHVRVTDRLHLHRDGVVAKDYSIYYLCVVASGRHAPTSTIHALRGS